MRYLLYSLLVKWSILLELATSKWIKENSAICELTGFPIEKMNKDRLYRGALKLYGIKEKLEQHLSIKSSRTRQFASFCLKIMCKIFKMSTI